MNFSLQELKLALLLLAISAGDAVSAPINDSCDNAVTIQNGAFQSDTRQATVDGEASCGSSNSTPDIWYRYTAPADGLLYLDTNGSNFDTVLSVHSACPGTIANELDCNRRFFTPDSEVTLPSVQAGDEMLVRISGRNQSAGMVALNVRTQSISGRVTEEATGSPLNSAFVSVYGLSGEFIDGGRTDLDGLYTIPLPVGDYFVVTNNASTAFGPGLIGEVYPNAQCFLGDCEFINLGTAIALAENELVTDIDFALAEGGSISGTVSDEVTASPISSEIQIFDDQGILLGGAFANSGSFRSGIGLISGTYFVRTRAPGNYKDEAFDDIPCSACNVVTGTPISVTAGVETTNIDFALVEGGSISGVVTDRQTGLPIGNLEVAVFNDQGIQVRGNFTDSEGNYTAGGLEFGSYFLLADPGFSNYQNQVYDGLDCAEDNCDPASGSQISISTNSAVSDVNFALSPLGSVSGNVIDTTTGGPIAYARIQAHDVNGDVLGAARASSSGAYTLRLVAESAVITASAPSYVSELYDNLACPNLQCDFSTGTAITISAGSSNVGIDFTLEDQTTLIFLDGFE